MKKLLLIFLLSCLMLSQGFAQISMVMKGSVYSEILGAEKEYNIYIPAEYYETDKDYPVLYLLHGA